MSFILVDEYDHDSLKGQPKYFKQMTAIGPMSTPNIEEAEQYETEEEAKQSPANHHWSANWRVEAL